MLRTGGAPVIVLSQSTRRETGPRVQLANIAAAKMVADVIRTSLGPKVSLEERS